MKYAVTPLCSVLAIYAGTANAEMNFNRLAAFETTRNMSAGEDLNRESSAEIIAATEDGMTLVYTVDVERLLSTASYILSNERNKLKPEDASKVLFLKRKLANSQVSVLEYA